MKKNFKINFNSTNQTKIVLHILVWLMFFSLPLYNMFVNPRGINTDLMLMLLMTLGEFYLNFSVLVPKYMLKKRWKIYFLLLVPLFTIHIVTFFYMEPFVPNPDDPLMNHDLHNNLPKDSSFKLFPGISLFVLMISVSSFLKIYEFWNENFKREREIDNQNRISELNFLKAQLNPHFFFNSLNTIYSLSISKSSKTSNAILNLSELMRYMLAEKRDNGIEKKVKLSEEIAYINNYIALQKLRITPNNKVNLNIQGDPSKFNVYPLLFISFIENAFKFGVHPTHENIIEINFIIADSILTFEVINPIHIQKKSYDSFGLGNDNSVKRLNLYYPDNKFEIITTREYYKVTLTLEDHED